MSSLPTSSSHAASKKIQSLLEGHHYAVGGLGKNGFAVVQKLLSYGASVHAWDDHHPHPPKDLGKHPNLTYGIFKDKEDFKKSHAEKAFNALILSPGIPHHLPKPHPIAEAAREISLPLLSDAEILYQIIQLLGSKARFISITGTNGKSTTTTLLGHILEQAGYDVALGGNLGTASLDLPLLGDNGIYILEMSSYMLERLQEYHADAAIFLNLTPDHLERHGSLEEYGEAKFHIFDHMNEKNLAIFGEKTPLFEEYAQRLRAAHIPTKILSLEHPYSLEEAPSLPGKHNAQNIAACAEVAYYLGVQKTVFSQALKSFQGLAHRLQKIHVADNIAFINDSKATNAEATAHALAAYENILWIAGGVSKAQGIEPLAPLFSKIAHSFLIGQDAPLFAQTLTKYHQEFTLSKTLEQAIKDAVKMAKERNLSLILLSPACASFDQFKNFEERGTFFTTYVQHYFP